MSAAGRPPTCSIIKGRFAISTFAKRPWTTLWTRCWTSSSASSPAGNNQRTDPQESYSGDSPDFGRQKEQIESEKKSGIVAPVLIPSRSYNSPSKLYSQFRRTLEYNRSEEHTSELQSPCNLVCRLLLEKKKKKTKKNTTNK